MRNTLVGMTIQKHLLHIFQASQHAFMQGANALVFFMHFQLGNAISLAHTDALVRGQGA